MFMNNLLRRYVLAAFLFAPMSVVLAQDMDIEVTLNEPERVKFVAQVKYFGDECGIFDALNLQAGIAADYYFPKAISLHVAYNLSYLSLAVSNANSLNSDDNVINKYHAFELGGRFHFIDRPGHHRMHITLNMSNDGNYITETYTHITYPTRQIVAVRGGIYMNNMPVNSDWNTASPPANQNSSTTSTGGIKATDGTVLGGTSFYTEMHSFGFYLGISNMYIINASYTHGGENGGHKYKMWMSELFGDIIVIPSFTFDDILLNGNRYIIKPNVSGSFQMQSIGWRIGLNRLKPKSGSMCFGFEAGMRPGISGHTFYFGCSMGFNITNRTKDKVTKQS